MNHLSEEQIQSYLDSNFKNNEIKNHLEVCDSCKSNLMVYQKVNIALTNERIPALSNFAISTILNKLDNPKEKKLSLIENVIISLMFIVGIFVSLYVIDIGNIIAAFNSIDFNFISDWSNEFINVISPNYIYLIISVLIFISIEVLDRVKINHSHQNRF